MNPDPQGSLDAPAPRETDGLISTILLRLRLGSSCHSCARGRSSVGDPPFIKKPPSRQQTRYGQDFTQKPTRGACIAFSPRTPHAAPQLQPPPRTHSERVYCFLLVSICISSRQGSLLNFPTSQGRLTTPNASRRLTRAA